MGGQIDPRNSRVDIQNNPWNCRVGATSYPGSLPPPVWGSAKDPGYEVGVGGQSGPWNPRVCGPLNLRVGGEKD